MKVLITGAGGQLGRALQAVLPPRDTLALPRTTLDITDLEGVRKVLGRERPDCVVNAAAWNRVDDAEQEVEAAYRGNALGPRNLAVACAESGARLVHVSTDYVFDGESGRPYHEFDRPNPRSVYGASKLAGEEAVREQLSAHYVVRTSWLYAAEGSNFPHTMLALADRPEVRVVSDQFGSPTWAPHLAQAIARLLETHAFGTYHLTGGGATSWYGFACALYQALGIHTPVRAVPTSEFPRPARRPRFSVLTTLQSPELRLPPWEEGLREFVATLPGRKEAPRS